MKERESLLGTGRYENPRFGMRGEREREESGQRVEWTKGGRTVQEDGRERDDSDESEKKERCCVSQAQTDRLIRGGTGD